MTGGDRSADLVITGRTATLSGERGFGWATAIAIADGRVVAAGTEASVGSLVGPATECWRLGPDRVVVPGLTDAHLHLLHAALTAQQLDLSGAMDRASTLGAIARRHAALADDAAWLLGHGWLLDRLGGWPTAEDLDGVAPGRAVALWSHDHHSRWVSSTALAAAGIDASAGDPAGGLVRRDARGQPSGILHEEAAKLVDHAIPALPGALLATALQDYAARLAAHGIVGCHDPGELVDEPELTRGPTLYARLAAEGRLPLRVHASVRAVQIDRAVGSGLRSGRGVEAREAGDPVAARKAARYRMGWLKLFADGAMGSRSAALLQPYEDAPKDSNVGGRRGMLLFPRERLAGDAARAASAGISVQIHAIGDAAVRVALDILETLPRTAGAPAHRVEHAQLVDPADIPRFARAGIAASVQPAHIASDAATAALVWGARTAHAFPLGELERSGALMPFGTDAPVESPDPWPGIGLAVTRAHPGWPASQPPFHAEQSLDLARALRAACLDPALVAGEDDHGRLVPGHRADLVVLPAEALVEPVSTSSALFGLRPLATLIDGEVVHRDPDFDP